MWWALSFIYIYIYVFVSFAFTQTCLERHKSGECPSAARVLFVSYEKCQHRPRNSLMQWPVVPMTPVKADFSQVFTFFPLFFIGVQPWLRALKCEEGEPGQIRGWMFGNLGLDLDPYFTWKSRSNCMFISSPPSHSRTLLNPHLSPNRVPFVLQVWLSTHIYIFSLRFATVKSQRTVSFAEEMQPNVALALPKSFTSALFIWHIGRSHCFWLRHLACRPS